MSNRIYPHPIIAREGWPILAGALIAVIVSWMLDLGIITFLFFVFLVFAFQFFRDPAREAPEDPRAVVSPVDGRVCKVEKCTNPETGEDAVKVSIFMNVFNVHSQKSPVAGVVEKVTYTPGLFVNADLDKASTENERNAVTVRMAAASRLFRWRAWWLAALSAMRRSVKNWPAASATALFVLVPALTCICRLTPKLLLRSATR